jgi:hypothetical protein
MYRKAEEETVAVRKKLRNAIRKGMGIEAERKELETQLGEARGALEVLATSLPVRTHTFADHLADNTNLLQLLIIF